MITINNNGINLLISTLPDSNSLQPRNCDYTQSLIKNLQKNGKNISWKRQTCPFELPTIQFNLSSRGYEVILRADKREDILKSMCIVAVMVFARRRDLFEYNKFSSLKELFDANPEVEQRYLQMHSKVAL